MGVICKKYGVFFGAVQMPKGTDPYSPQTGNGIRDQIPQGQGWKEPNP